MKLCPPSGFRDFEPKEMILRKRIIDIIENCFIRYGFDPIETPAIEHWEVFEGKYGEEAENKLIYRFKDPWSNKIFALRFDLTVPMARFFAQRAFPLPFKRYHIGRVWRHERPQKGRYREFWQADADIIGSSSPETDAELIDLTIHIFEKLGFKNFILKLNDRRLLKGIFEEELRIKEVLQIYRAIDKLDKIGLEGVKGELEKIISDKIIVRKILEIISWEKDTDDLLEYISSNFLKNENVRIAINHLTEMLDLLSGRKSFLKLSLNLVRGLDYYTGPVWEVIISDLPLWSVAGGGRYDNLIELYSGKTTPASGTSIGIERVIDAGKEIGLFTTSKQTYTQIYVAPLSMEFYKFAWDIANVLRKNGFCVQIDLMRRSEKKQREYVSKKNIPIIIFVGKKEVKNKILTIFFRDAQERAEIPSANLINYLKEHISHCG